MEDFYQILQNTIGMEREIFVIGSISRIAMIDVLVLESLEVGIRRIVFLEALVCLVCRVIVLHEPYIGILCLVEYGFKA